MILCPNISLQAAVGSTSSRSAGQSCVCSALSPHSNVRVFVLLCVHTCICLYSHTCVPPCVCSVSTWGSICVRLTRWEPLSAGSPAGPKSSGRPEAWNPSRPGQMSLCSGRLSPPRPHRPLGADTGSWDRPQNIDFTRRKWPASKMDERRWNVTKYIYSSSLLL